MTENELVKLTETACEWTIGTMLKGAEMAGITTRRTIDMMVSSALTGVAVMAQLAWCHFGYAEDPVHDNPVVMGIVDKALKNWRNLSV